MDSRLSSLAAARGGVFTRTDTIACGYSEDAIDRRIRRGVWHRLRRGVYVEATSWQGLGPGDQHRLAIRAASLRCDPDAVFSHVSAAVQHRWWRWGVDLDDVWLTRADRHAPRREANLRHHRAALPTEEIAVVDGIQVTISERTMVDVAREYPFEQAVVMCDSALRLGADRERAYHIARRCCRWPGARGVFRALEFANPLSESPGESRLRVLCHDQDLPEPQLQAAVYGPDGHLLGRGDLLFEDQWTLVEFDGVVKYGMDGQDPRRQMFEEKRREDAIREFTGLEVVRVTWQDLGSPDRTAARIRAAFTRAARRRRLAA